MNYFLDTNIVIILYEGRYTELKSPILRILEDSQNLFYVSSISLLEIAQLYRKKKFKHIDYDLLDTGDKLIRAILNTIPIIKVLPFKEEHALIASTLTFVPKHNDPTDLAIIAHAIDQKVPIITCDDKFPEYQLQGAVVIHNPR